MELTDDEIGTYYDRTVAPLVDDLPEEGQAFLRSQFIQGIRDHPEAMRQLREWLNDQSS